jgi:NifU-like protein involved in Fe-S cluster formation
MPWLPRDDARYSPDVLRRLHSLPGAGLLDEDGQIARGRAGDREQGAEVELSLRIEAGLVADARFRAFGCPHVLAAASWLTEAVRGRDQTQLAAWDWHEAATALQVPPAKFGRLLTVQDALHAAARNWPGAPGSTV